MTRAMVYYEDQRAVGGGATYGPHMLVMACVADETGGDAWALAKQVAPNPKKGDSKLLKAIAADMDRLERVIVVFDDDQVRRLLGLEKNACKTSVLERLRHGLEDTGSADVILLERNTEDVVHACCEALPRQPPEGKPTPTERDAIMMAAATAPKLVRDAVREKIPSFDRLVRAVKSAVESG